MAARDSFASRVWQTDLTESTLTDVEGVGTLRWSGNKLYRWVMNNEASTALALGDSCAHQGANTSTMFEKVLIPLTEDLMFLAGVAIGAIASKSFGWIQVLGYNASVYVKNASGTTYTVGSYLKAVTAVVSLTFDIATQPSYLRTIQNLESVATVTTTLIATTYIKCNIQCL